MTKVSIIVPTYNVEQYLHECMDSIINQTLKDIEIICVDDGSKDNSGKILDEYAAKDNRIKVIHKENGGYGKAMNVGLDNATGEYIGIVEPDDYVELDMYETLYNKAVENNVDLIKADFYRFVGTGETIQLFYNRLDKSKKYYNRVINLHEDLTPFTFIMNTWSGIYKKDFIEKYHIRHNTTPGASFQDNGFWFQSFALAQRAYFLDKPFYMNRRDNPNSSVKDKGKVYLMKYEYDYIRKFLEEVPDRFSKFISIYTYKKFHSYLFNYNRIDIQFKKEFLQLFSKEFKQAAKNNELDYKWFSKSELEKLKLIIYNPTKFYRKSLNKLSFNETFFSIKNSGIHKVVTIFGIKFKFKSKKLIERTRFAELETRICKTQKNINNIKNELQKEITEKETTINNLLTNIDKLKRELDNQEISIYKKLQDETLSINNEINSFIKKYEKNQLYYNNEFEVNTRRERGLCDIVNALNFENRFSKLISGLAPDDIATIVTIIRRLQLIKDNNKHLDIFSEEEKSILKDIAIKKQHILKISDNKYCYQNYFLPINHFEESVFYHKHGLHLVKNLENIKNRDIIDVGAFIGDSALILSPYTNNKVYSFEAVSKNYEYLNQTIAMNGLKNIVPIKCALGDEEGTLDIRVCSSGSSISELMIKNPEDIEKCPVTTLDKYVNENNINVGLIKVDIEGAEQKFLAGAFETIKKQKPTLLVSIYHTVDDFLDIKSIIESWDLNYEFRIFKPTIMSVSGETLLICEQKE